MPNLFKRFSPRAKAEPYRFPDAAELMREEEKPPKEESLWRPEQFDGPEDEDLGGSLEPPEDEPLPPAPEPEPEPEPEPVKEETPQENPVKFAQIQADKLLEDARARADEILDKARLDAELEADRIRAEARDAGRLEGYTDGLTQGNLEARQAMEERAAVWEAEIAKFLERAGGELDRKFDDSVEELRDLAMAIAEKVVGISLKSSSDVICRMIQNAVDKKKRREWVHIYISECDAKGLGQIPASLSTALTALSGRVRLIPIADDEPGTCIIETPDEIIDASAATQLNNIRSLLMDTASSADGGGFFL